MTNEDKLYDISRNITYKYFGNSLRIGKHFSYRGRPIKIVDGCFLDPVYQRLSNFWNWREVLPNGGLSEKKESGYGGDDSIFKPISKKEAIRIALNLGV